MLRDWARRSLQRRLLLSLLVGVGLSLAAFQIVVDQLVDRYIQRRFAGPSVDIVQRDRLLREVDIVLFGGVVIVLGVCAAVAVLAVRRGLAPLERVAAAAQEISIDRPGRDLPLEELPAELRSLGERFNQLIERLTQALEHERRFAASLAHELRTPLAEIRALGEAGLARQDVAGLHEFLQQTTAAATGMQSIVESLLAVARADRVAVQQALEPLCMSVAVRARIERLRVLDPAGCARIVSRVPEAVWVESDPRLLDAVLLNLLANAVQHGDEHAPIEVDWLEEASSRALGALQVRNRAPHLVRAELPQLTARPGGRGAGEMSGTGTGLGLWVVASLCGVLGLHLVLDLDDTQHLSVRLAGFRAI